MDGKKWRQQKSGSSCRRCWTLMIIRASNRSSLTLFHHHHLHIRRTASEIDASAVNRGQDPMPIGLGYHTSFRYPLNESGDKEKCLFTLPASKHWTLTDRMLPTGEYRVTEEFKAGKWQRVKGLMIYWRLSKTKKETAPPSLRTASPAFAYAINATAILSTGLCLTVHLIRMICFVLSHTLG
ncbi:hypothetical protein PO124_31160 [Bacillus licheniformis]|nr:hypothetical protein [Bacillus licheniformis]